VAANASIPGQQETRVRTPTGRPDLSERAYLLPSADALIRMREAVHEIATWDLVAVTAVVVPSESADAATDDDTDPTDTTRGAVVGGSGAAHRPHPRRWLVVI
jgi:hypothetical protein